MRGNGSADPEAPWIALFCTGILLTSLAAVVCVGVLAFYHASLESVQSVIACFAAGAVCMILAAARLEALAISRAADRRR
ncbi:MAG: hypothetical protein U0821_10810 [Chloroflexota bacterium]